MLADFDDSKFKALPLKFRFWFRFRRYTLPKSVWDVKFERFMSAVNLLSSDFAMCEFLEITTIVDKIIFNSLKISLSLPLYEHYKSECEKILTMFKEVGDEAPKATVMVKDLQEFGLLPYMDFIAEGDISKYKEVKEMPMHEIYTYYRLKVHHNINAHANAKANVKSN